MSDQLLTSDAASQGTSGAPQPVTQPASVTDKQVQAAPVNLHNLPEFRSVQSSYEKQIAELRRQANEAKMAGMDDFERVQFENQQLREQLASLDAERHALAEEQARIQQLREIAQESGAPVSILEQAASPAEAWRMALQYTKQQAMQAPPPVPVVVPQAQNGNSWSQPQAAPSTPAFVPDLGGGTANTSTNRLQQELADAIKAGDAVAYTRAVRLLKEAGEA
jgi:translation initiation factor IF-2